MCRVVRALVKCRLRYGIRLILVSVFALCFLHPLDCEGTDDFSTLFKDVPRPYYPFQAERNKEEGTVWVRIKFASDGSVAQCRVVRSTASAILDQSTVDFIQKHWSNPKYAGRTGIVPVAYALSGGKLASDFSPPPYVAKLGTPTLEVTLTVTFGQDGFISKAHVSQSSGHQDVDDLVLTWAKVHWHHSVSAGQTVDIPVELKPPVLVLKNSS